jgi:dTDP-4-amino-4,6-dideoxygalactose transaminase
MNIFSGTNTDKECSDVKIFLRENGNEIVKGPLLVEYESILRSKLRANLVFTFASGRMGFYSILQSIDIRPGDEVIIPSYTCIVVPNAIIYSGAKPVYCDIDLYDFNIDVQKIEKLITKNTRVIYAQHTFGQMCDMEAIMRVAEKNKLIVIEDSALALGAKSSQGFAGTIGDFGYYSTDRSKVINTGLGGVVSVNNSSYDKYFQDFYQTVPFLDNSTTRKIARTFLLNVFTLNPRNYWFGKFINLVLSKLGILFYFLDENHLKKDDINKYPYPARFSNILAMVGISQIKMLKNNISTRRSNANFYNEILEIYSSDYINDKKNVFLRFSFLVKNRDYWKDRFASEIDLSIWFETLFSGRDGDFKEIYYHGGNLNSEFACEHVFNLPTHKNIKPEKLSNLLNELKTSGDILIKEKK